MDNYFIAFVFFLFYSLVILLIMKDRNRNRNRKKKKKSVPVHVEEKEKRFSQMNYITQKDFENFLCEDFFVSIQKVEKEPYHIHYIVEDKEGKEYCVYWITSLGISSKVIDKIKELKVKEPDVSIKAKRIMLQNTGMVFFNEEEGKFELKEQN